MDYNFNFLTPGTFEHLIQSLSRKILGNGLTTFGDGPDGVREATFDGKAPFPSEKKCWKGKWVIQAKFKAREDNKKDFNWVKKEFEKEMEKFETRKVKVEIPDNYLFFTNVVLTPTVKAWGSNQKLAPFFPFKQRSDLFYRKYRIFNYLFVFSLIIQ